MSFSSPKTPKPQPAPKPTNKKDRLRRLGRSSLIATSPQGVLGNQQGKRKQLTASQPSFSGF